MPPSPDSAFLGRAWAVVTAAAATAELCVVLGTERIVDDALRITALVINRDGTLRAFKIKCSWILPRKLFIPRVLNGGFSRMGR